MPSADELFQYGQGNSLVSSDHFPEPKIRKILGENWLRLLDEVWREDA